MTSRSRSIAAPLVLVSLVTALTVELVRASGPMFDRAFNAGVVVAAVVALVTYATPGIVVTALARGRTVTGRTVHTGVVVLGVARLAVQALGGDARFVVALVAVAVAVGVLVLTVGLTAKRSPGATALAVSTGAVGAAGVSLMLGTWDAVWRHDVAGWSVTLVLVAASIGTAWTVRGEPGGAVRGLWTLGPYLAIVVAVAANPAYLASQLGLSLPWAGVVVVGGLVAAAVLVLWTIPTERARYPRSGRWSAPFHALLAAVTLAAVGLPFGDRGAVADPSLAVGFGVMAAMLMAFLTAGLAAAWDRPVTDPRGPFARAGAASAAGLGTIVPLLVYQLDYDVPLGFPNHLVLVGAAVVLGAGAARGAWAAGRTLTDVPAPSPAAARRSLLPAVGVVVVVGLVGSALNAAPAPELGPVRAEPVVRLLSWNVHFGVTPAPGVDLDRLADVIRGADPDVVALQEVSRGWVMGGGADMATYLARATGMRFVAAPAADRQFVNVLLVAPRFLDPSTEMPAGVVRTRLPYGDGPQWRSAVTATVPVPGTGADLTVTSAHLQHRAENTPTRLAQLDALLAAELADGSAVLAGDLNAEPGWPEPDLLTDAGWTSAQDTAGDPAALTFPAHDPQVRIDWVLGRDVTFESLEVLDDATSDHRPLLAVIRVP
ncbi:hypothetical protein GCM10011331_03170 [Flavimobilis marinus]|uniref:Metal-dependent hydrolase, endonuclease/exonuclease/phosphatase family n=1 Tax=Flavimobilis marinus TaxID=285351 RepID=A0A1I2DRX8_9MICO|nr:endonuclease/exonuclease/phosphatase family protein [Flavimobilis marinus]GHG44548.1 hypothetical protein GCM10011331_03170 [Flavimobilis marinus]SFE83021.1 Metal-dependent hydrolase, endonuclease/exonuclease/phosphatase family [Flavimobilis marinus]